MKLPTMNKANLVLLTVSLLLGSSLAAHFIDSHCCDDETTHSEILERSAGTCSDGHHSPMCTCDQSHSRPPENVCIVVPATIRVKVQYYNKVSPSLQPPLSTQGGELITRLKQQREFLHYLPIHIPSTILRV